MSAAQRQMVRCIIGEELGVAASRLRDDSDLVDLGARTLRMINLKPARARFRHPAERSRAAILPDGRHGLRSHREQAGGAAVMQNVSSAVMQQRREARDSLDDFPTPPWATRALCEFLLSEGHELGAMAVAEPAANRGHMVRPLLESFGAVLPSDVHDYGCGYSQRDYLFGPDAHWDRVDWTITNPPFRLAEQFIERALRLSRHGVAMFVRGAFLEGIGRYERLYATKPPTDVLQFTERVVLHKGRLAPEGSSATAYAWLVWQKDREDAPFSALSWIAPCRKRLERADDYPVEETA